MLRGAVDAKKRYTVQCPRSCCRGNTFNAEFPNYQVMLEVAKWMTERAEGKASQKPAQPEKPRQGASISRASDEELEALLDSTED